jgi:hypothetical protein
VVVRPVQSAADLSRFIAFPYRLYRGDPYWVPPLRFDVRKMLSREKNPFFQHADAEYFLAVGRSGGRADSELHDRPSARPPVRPSSTM